MMEDIPMLTTHNPMHGKVASALLGAGMLLTVSPASATNNGLEDWRSVYPNSNSDDAGCQLCHGNSLGQLNAYGRDLCLVFEANGAVPSEWQDAIQSIAALNSDNDPNASSNAQEIANNTQPGWTTTSNPLFVADFTEGCAQIASDSTVPNNVPVPYDIVVTGDPIANTGGPYSALVGTTITFDGSGSTDDGEIIQYDWNFGDGAIALDAGPNPEHIYNAEGIYSVILTVTDNDRNTNSAQTTATISPVELLDLDISALQVGKNARIGKPVTISLKVRNNGTVLGQAIATVVGMQNNIEVFRRRLNVFDDIGRGDTTFDFGSYTPTTSGEITWTATIADGNPDNDETTATTSVR